MEIQSSLYSGLQGFNKAQNDASDAATAIANNIVQPETTINSPQTANNADSVNNNTGNQTSLSQEVVNLKVAEHQASASAKVIRSADENLGTLLDVRV